MLKSQQKSKKAQVQKKNPRQKAVVSHKRAQIRTKSHKNKMSQPSLCSSPLIASAESPFVSQFNHSDINTTRIVFPQRRKLTTSTHTDPELTSLNTPFSTLPDPSSLYVTAQWLSQQFDENFNLPKRLKIVSVHSSTDPDEYMIPHTHLYDLNQFSSDLYGKPNTFPQDPPFSNSPTTTTKTQWNKTTSPKELNIEPNDDVVVYDTSGHLGAPRLLWQLVAGGINLNKVKILEGGLINWVNGEHYIDTNQLNGNNPDNNTPKYQLIDVPVVSMRGIIADTLTRENNNNSDDNIKTAQFNTDTDVKYRANNEIVFKTVEHYVKQFEEIDKNNKNVEFNAPILIDTRPTIMYQQAHLPGSINLPYPTMIQPFSVHIPEKNFDNNDKTVPKMIDQVVQGAFTGNKDDAFNYIGNVLNMVNNHRKKNSQNDVIIDNDKINLIFTCQTGQTASTGWFHAMQFLQQRPIINDVEYSFDNVNVQVWDPSFYVYGNPQFEVPNVPDSTQRRHFEHGPSKLLQFM